MSNVRYAAGERIVWDISASGMQCVTYPKRGFGQKMAAIVVPYGANGLLWRKKGSVRAEQFPKGIAHFIEHKLFAQAWGDAMQRFAKQGAVANAFTDGERTVYYFTCRDDFDKNLKLLLDFVQHPYFTEENVEREKDIITSEISLYDNRADWVGYYQMLDMLYTNHCVKYPIAGTIESVKHITAEDLQKVYDACYLPQEFTLICVGDVQPFQVLQAAQSVKRREKKGLIVFGHETEAISEKYREYHMHLRQPVFQIGFKLPERKKDLAEKMAIDFLLDIWAGESSPFFAQAYKKEYLDEPLGRGYFCGEGYAFCAFSGSGTKAEATAELLLDAWKNLQKEGIAKEDFQRLQKKHIGQILRKFQSVQALGMAQIDLALYGADVGEWFRLSKELHKQDVEKLLQNTIQEDKMVLSIVR